MSERKPIALWKFWPIPVVAVMAGFELYYAQAEERPVDWVFLGLLAAAAVFIIILRGLMGVK